MHKIARKHYVIMCKLKFYECMTLNVSKNLKQWLGFAFSIREATSRVNIRTQRQRENLFF